MSSINGNSQTKFSYSTQINEIGTHIIGPAQIEYQGKKYVSNTITIHVVTEKADFGPVLKRVFVSVEKDDTVDTLYKRLKNAESEGLIEVLKNI